MSAVQIHQQKIPDQVRLREVEPRGVKRLKNFLRIFVIVKAYAHDVELVNRIEKFLRINRGYGNLFAEENVVLVHVGRRFFFFGECFVAVHTLGEDFAIVFGR